jgi:Domain of unknown function (DUF6484)
MASYPLPRQASGTELESKIAGPLHGVIKCVDRDGRPLVKFEGGSMPVAARLAASLQGADTSKLAGAGVILIFEQGDSSRPIIVDFVRDSFGATDQPTTDAQPQGFSASFEVKGRTVILEGKEEIVLRCGQGSLTIRADGQVVIKGTRLMSKASETNKVRGSSVLIN